MELRQLRYLIALAEEGSFTRAATNANVAQPALSRQIQKLERELGLPLVDRTTRRVAITPAGQEVAATGRRVLGELEALTHSLQQTMNLLRGTVTIGVTQTPGPIDVPRILAAFNRRHPGVELILREGLSVDLASQLREDRLDLALISAISARERRGLVKTSGSAFAGRPIARLRDSHASRDVSPRTFSSACRHASSAKAPGTPA